MRKQQTLDILKVCLAGNIPVKLESLPGAGKTSFLNALVQANNGYLHTMVAVNHDPTDFGGIPVPDSAAGAYNLLPGQWAVDLAKAVETHDLVVVFLDEVNTAGRAVLAACLKLVDERRVGNFPLPPEVRVVLAVNPAEANGGVDLTPAMANRVAHIPNFHIPEDVWFSGLESGTFAAPDPIRLPTEDELLPFIRKHGASIAAYLRHDPEHIESYPDDPPARCKAWPSRRTWTLGVRAMATAEWLGYGQDVQEAALGALVGTVAADAYADWAEVQTAINVEEYFQHPDTAELPDRDDLLFPTLDRIAAEAVARGTQEALDAACEVLVRVATSGRPGVGAAAMRSIASHVVEHKELLSGTVRSAIQVFRPVIAQMQQGGRS